LPPGRHHLAREVVAANQRARILAAMSETVADKTYCEATVADVVALAEVSRRTFYEHFSSKLDCFLAAYDAATEVLIKAIASAVSQRRGWRSRLHAGIGAYLEALGSSPGFARMYLLEVVRAGDAALERRQAVHRRFVSLYRELNAMARAEEPAVRTVTDEEFLLVVGGTDQLVAAHLEQPAVEQIPDLAATVESVVSSLLLPSGSARRL
jgi:AcrR family transcriptional regulator